MISSVDENRLWCGFNQVDFKDAPRRAADDQQMVEEKTDDKIMNMLQPGVLNPRQDWC